MIPKIMASTKRFGIFIRNESDITQAICRKKTLTIEVSNKIKRRQIDFVFYKIAM